MEARWMDLLDLEPVVGMSVLILKKDPRKTIRSIQKIHRNAVMVVTHENSVVGYMLYRHEGDAVRILQLCVIPQLRRKGGGTSMLRMLLDGYAIADIPKPIEVIIGERDSVAQKFFKSLGFKASEILKDHFKSQDAYVFKYTFDKVIKENANGIEL